MMMMMSEFTYTAIRAVYNDNQFIKIGNNYIYSDHNSVVVTCW